MMYDSACQTFARNILPRWIVIGALFFVSACSTGTGAPIPHAPAVPAQPVLKLGELREFENGLPIVVLYRNGLLEERGKPLGTLHEDGRFFDLLGHLCAEMKADGRIAIEGGEIRVAGDGSASIAVQGVEQSRIHVDDTGRVVGTRNETRIEGVSPELRRTAVFVLLLPDIIRLQQTKMVQ